jgi:type II secretory pathway component PulJ
MPGTSRGVALLEVLVALALLSATGLALAELVGAGLHSEQDSRSRERTLATEERALAALSLLGRSDLDRRLGRHRLGEFVVNVDRPEATLYRIALADTIASDVEALVTVVYRREPRNAP